MRSCWTWNDRLVMEFASSEIRSSKPFITLPLRRFARKDLKSYADSGVRGSRFLFSRQDVHEATGTFLKLTLNPSGMLSAVGKRNFNDTETGTCNHMLLT